MPVSSVTSVVHMLPDLAVPVLPVPHFCVNPCEHVGVHPRLALAFTVWVHRIGAFDLVVSSMADEDPIGEVEADAAVDEKDKQRSQQNKAMNAMTDTVRTMVDSGQGVLQLVLPQGA